MKPASPPPTPFDPQRRAASPVLKADIKRMVAHLETTEKAQGLRTRSRKDDDRRKFATAVEAIACNLIAVDLMQTSRPLAVPRSSSVMWSAGRYRTAVYGQHFLDALALMALPAVGWIEDLERGFRHPNGDARPSTIRPTDAFRAVVSPAVVAAGWLAIGREDLPEVLILKSRKDDATGEADRIDYKETGSTAKMRREVERINKSLRAAPVDLLPAREPRNPSLRPIDPTRKTVRRIFNNAEWNEGGRLYDGFWETMERSERFDRLRIEGERIANVDFGQLFLRLLYARLNMPAPAGDLYDIDGDGTCRAGWKVLINALLFAEKPLTHLPDDARKAFPAGTKMRDVVARAGQRHPAISHFFGSGIGHKLAFTESVILILIVLRLFKMGIVALPLHDSVLVSASSALDAERVMIEEAESAGYARAAVSVTFAE